MFIFDRERACVHALSGGGGGGSRAEREGNRGSKADSMLTAVSLMLGSNCEIMT